jgi:hypothetical protein
MVPKQETFFWGGISYCLTINARRFPEMNHSCIFVNPPERSDNENAINQFAVFAMIGLAHLHGNMNARRKKILCEENNEEEVCRKKNHSNCSDRTSLKKRQRRMRKMVHIIIAQLFINCCVAVKTHDSSFNASISCK